MAINRGDGGAHCNCNTQQQLFGRVGASEPSTVGTWRCNCRHSLCTGRAATNDHRRVHTRNVPFSIVIGLGRGSFGNRNLNWESLLCVGLFLWAAAWKSPIRSSQSAPSTMIKTSQLTTCNLQLQCAKKHPASDQIDCSSRLKQQESGCCYDSQFARRAPNATPNGQTRSQQASR